MKRALPQAAKVSIVLPFRDAADTIEECLDSIISQTLASFELIAIDDGSTDRSLERLGRVGAGDDRIRVFSPGRLGLVAALNFGIARAEAPLIARMDADDIMHPARLERQRDFLARRRNVALVGCRVELFPSSGIRAGYREYVRWQNGCVSAEDIADNIYVESPFAHPSVMVRRSVFDKLGGYAEGEFPEDYDMWLRMHRAGYRMAKLEDVLLYWRDRPGRLSRVDRRYAREAFDRVRAEYLAEDRRLQGQRPVVVWGAGRRTRQRARLLIDRGVVPVAWIDIDPRKIGHTVWGHPVRSADWLAERRPRPFVLVYVTRHGARDEVSKYLESVGYRRGRDYLAVG